MSPSWMVKTDRRMGGREMVDMTHDAHDRYDAERNRVEFHSHRMKSHRVSQHQPTPMSSRQQFWRILTEPNHPTPPAGEITACDFNRLQSEYITPLLDVNKVQIATEDRRGFMNISNRSKRSQKTGQERQETN